jgi:uncharacterized Tic20 family protein
MTEIINIGGYHPIPQPEELTIREREDAMGAYLMMFAALGAGLPLPIINMIAAIIYYYINKSKSRFIRFHSLQSLLSQIPVTILNAVLVFWTVHNVFSGLTGFDSTYAGFVIMAVIANLLYFIFSIIGAVRARKGRFYYFLFFGRVTYNIVYRINPEESIVEIVNKPPL